MLVIAVLVDVFARFLVCLLFNALYVLCVAFGMVICLLFDGFVW